MVPVSWKIILVTALVSIAGIALHSPLVAVLAQTTGKQDNKTAWESYKNRPFSQSVDQHLTDPALVGAIDLHAHSDPDSYPRQWVRIPTKAGRIRGRKAGKRSRHAGRAVEEPLDRNRRPSVPCAQIWAAGH